MTRPNFSTHGGTQRQSRAGILLGIGLVALVLGFANAVAAWRERAAVERSLAELRQAAESIPRTPEGGADEEKVRRQLALAVTTPPAAVLDALASLLPDDVRYSSLDVIYGPSVRVDLGVEAKSAAGYDALVRRIAESADIDQIVPGSEAREREIVGRIRATFRSRP